MAATLTRPRADRLPSRSRNLPPEWEKRRVGTRTPGAKIRPGDTAAAQDTAIAERERRRPGAGRRRGNLASPVAGGGGRCMDRRRRGSHCRPRSSHQRRAGAANRFARRYPCLVRSAALREGQRLSEELVLRLRGPGKERSSARRNRRAAVKVRDAEAQFAKTTYARWRDSPRGVVSVQEQEAKRADYQSGIARFNAAKADMAMAQADVDRLESLQGFKQVVAPFDGVVTARETDIGALINAGSHGTARDLFSVADTHKVRIYVKVPQRQAGNIHPGLTAELRLPQYPGKVFTAKATTTSRSVNTSSRTLLVELQAENPDGLLQPGTYVEAQLNLPSDPSTMLMPASAILFRQDGLEVAVIGDDDKVTLKKISLGRNLGVQVEVTGGLVPTDRIIDSPPDSLGSGDVVRIAGNPAPGNLPDGSEKEDEGT